jgi:cardiolipin synthase
MLQPKRIYMRYVPNALTILRLLMIPVFMYAFTKPGLWLPDRLLSLIVFIVANATDLLDGYIARKYNAITNFGRLADPVADKLIAVSALFCLNFIGRIPLLVVLLVLAKEGLMVIGSYIMLKFHVVVYSKWYGKAAAFSLAVGIAMTFWDTLVPYNLYLLYFSLALAYYALVHYAILAVKQFMEVKKNPDNPKDLYAER